MKAIKINEDKIILEISKHELRVISNALNEVCNNIEIWEFETRMGIDIEYAKIMLESLALIYKKATQTSSNNIETYYTFHSGVTVDIIKINEDKITLEISKDEIAVLGNALNEVCNGFKLNEFDKRMDTNIENASLILDSLISIYKKATQTLDDIED